MLVRSFLFLQCLVSILISRFSSNLVNAQSLENPVFWQVPLVYNTSNPLDQGSMVNNESRLAISQDFQVINVGDDAEYEHKRILIDMSNGCSKSTNLSTIQQWNDHQLTTSALRSQPKMALIERGECSWKEKMAAVSYLSFLYRLNIEAMMIYDNDTHGTNTSFDIQSIAPDNSQKPISYDTPLPFNRNITNMKDNDVTLERNGNNNSNANNNTFYLPVYFTTKTYGLYLKNLDHHLSSSSTKGRDSSTDLCQFYQIVPFLSTTPYENTSKKEDDGTGFSSMLTSSRGYLTYILVLVAVFVIGAILLRWWKVRKMQRRISVHNEHVVRPNHALQTRVNQVDPLPVPIVNSLPIVYYNVANVKNAICCICLDDYVENKSEVRVLPCGHGFCVLCIDPWLTQKSTLCPICKFDCLPADQRFERQQCQQQQQLQQEYDATTYDEDGHDIDLADATLTSNSAHLANILSGEQSTSRPTRHNSHHNDVPNPLQSSSLSLSAHQNDVSQPTSEQYYNIANHQRN